VTLTPFESQLLASSVIAVPAMGLLLYAVARGHFKRSEGNKFVVLASPERDYWEERDWGRLQEPSAPEGGERHEAIPR
jgi:hypothetical protein